MDDLRERLDAASHDPAQVTRFPHMCAIAYCDGDLIPRSEHDRVVAEKDARLDAIELLLAGWVDAQGFDPCGGPVADSDCAAVNAYLVAGGELESDSPAVLAAIQATKEREE